MTTTLTIAEIHDLCEETDVSPTAFWAYAMGGDHADLPRADVVRCLRALGATVHAPEPFEDRCDLDGTRWGNGDATTPSGNKRHPRRLVAVNRAGERLPRFERAGA